MKENRKKVERASELKDYAIATTRDEVIYNQDHLQKIQDNEIIEIILVRKHEIFQYNEAVAYWEITHKNFFDTMDGITLEVMDRDKLSLEYLIAAFYKNEIFIQYHINHLYAAAISASLPAADWARPRLPTQISFF